ncbi:hypothetical protein I6A60_22800 [Frankia sp. AgB1.9]|uniref:hypothetical protein n=1 Tax=unclassified Frankia TaxID=2632575 RepID=UPI0019317BC1|nr:MULTISPECIES: hypothetical protein [unclassified Frankia]MBL7491784.1 hypothetical protein [Frankia sp. AgW1.1]MBL7550679.1 hypothetical protein [Frankia sp. AgB1.9]MBL7621662.1 hypothetical protein [Frankia sp. AgB1.8]
MSARQVRRFQLERDVDVSGVSGTGAVAYGAQSPDGTCVLWWASGLESTTIYPNMDTLLAVHGHGGMTRAIYIDPESWDGAPGAGVDGGGDAADRLASPAAPACHGTGAGGPADAAEHEAPLAEPELDEEPAHAVSRAATSRGGPRAAAHQPATRAVSRSLRSPTRSA